MTEKNIEEREELTKKILSDAPRLKKEDKFNFSCHPGISCFNKCCADVNIVLTPLDVLRISRRLKMTTTDFLTEYTFVPFAEGSRLPFVFLKMNEENERKCFFVRPEGCGIYEDRPWPCRMYPVGEASPENVYVSGEGFYFLMNEDHCAGHKEDKEWTIQEWMDDQGVGQYREMGELYKGILLHPYLAQKELDPARMEMFYMASYDLDKFREFVFESRFLDRFEIEEDLVEKLRSDDIELLKFAFRWLRFAIFGEPVISVKKEILSEREREMMKNKNKS